MVTQMQIIQTLPLPLSASSSSTHHHRSSASLLRRRHTHSLPLSTARAGHGFPSLSPQAPTRKLAVALAAGEDTVSTSAPSQTLSDADPQDLEYVAQVKRVLELLRKNRDMLFSEVKLTIMIEDPRDAERRRLLGIEDQDDAPTRDDLAAALEEAYDSFNLRKKRKKKKVNEGKIPQNRVALRLLAEEMSQWPNVEVELETKKKKPSKSLYARATDTGVDPRVAAKRLKIDWDTAAEIDDADSKDETEVPPLLGYGALYLVTAFPVIIGVSVVLILFYNSLQ